MAVLLPLQHAESEINVNSNRVIKNKDAHLTQLGFAQSKLVKKRLIQEGFEPYLTLSSPYRRAIETAETVFGKAIITTDKRLVESTWMYEMTKTKYGKKYLEMSDNEIPSNASVAFHVAMTNPEKNLTISMLKKQLKVFGYCRGYRYESKSSTSF